jgi:hypothetical protein
LNCVIILETTFSAYRVAVFTKNAQKMSTDAIPMSQFAIDPRPKGAGWIKGELFPKAGKNVSSA